MGKVTNYTTQDGRLLDVPATKKNKDNPCVKLYGLGPVGAKCKTCAHLHQFNYARTFYKCEFRRGPNGRSRGSVQTDHHVTWPACARYKEDKQSNG